MIAFSLPCGRNWSESGLIVTERLMQTVFGLEPPPWLPAGTGISP